VGEVVPEPVRVDGYPGLLAAAGDHLVDAVGGQRLAVACAEPQLGLPGAGVPGAGAEVAVEADGGLVADLGDAVLAALAADGDLPLPQVGENCVEVANAEGVAVRDTKDRGGVTLTVPASAWTAFLGTLR
jgi:hypothetical protein